jgi:hypothetical protein
VVSDIDLEALAPAWRSFQNRTPVKFCTIKTKRHYRAMVNLLNEIVDEIGDRESHAMMGLLDIVSHFVHDYENAILSFRILSHTQFSGSSWNNTSCAEPIS